MFGVGPFPAHVIRFNLAQAALSPHTGTGAKVGGKAGQGQKGLPKPSKKAPYGKA